MTLENSTDFGDSPADDRRRVRAMSSADLDNLSSLPEIEEVEYLLKILSSELLATLTNGQDAHQFYLPFIIFLQAVASETDIKLGELWAVRDMSDEISVELEPGLPIKLVLIDQFFSPGQENLIATCLKMHDWFSFFVDQLQDIANEYFATRLAKEAQEQLTPEEINELDVDVITGRLREIVQEAIDRSGSFYPEPFKWSTTIIHGIARWLMLALKPEYRLGNPPYYIYADEEDFPRPLPQILKHGGPWASGFGGRLIVPNLEGLNDEQKAGVWGHLFFNKNIYDNERIDHSVRDEVFGQIEKTIPESAKYHLDLCGGMGHFISFLRTQRPDLESILIDITPEAVEHSKGLGIDARVGNADKALDLDKEMDVVTINFAVQWISSQAFKNILDVLKPGGLLTFNVYPIAEIDTEKYVLLLQGLGFDNVSYKKFQGVKKTSYIISAYKPLLKE